MNRNKIITLLLSGCFAISFLSILNLKSLSQNFASETGEWIHYQQKDPTSTENGIREYWIKCGGTYQFTNPGVSYTTKTIYDTSEFTENDPRWIKWINADKAVFYNLGSTASSKYDATELADLTGYTASTTPSTTVGDSARYLYYKDDYSPMYSASTLTVSQVLTADNFAETVWSATENKNGLYVLGADITSTVTSINSEAGKQNTYSFCGTIDGRGHYIESLVVSSPTTGIFGTQQFGSRKINSVTYKPTIKNLTIKNIERGSSNYQLRMFGWSFSDLVMDNCQFTLGSTIESLNSTCKGNIFSGTTSGKSSITNCVFDCKTYDLGSGAIISGSCTVSTEAKKFDYTGTTIKCIETLPLYATITNETLTPARDSQITFVNTSATLLENVKIYYDLSTGSVVEEELPAILSGYSFYSSMKKAAISWPSTANQTVSTIYALKDNEAPYLVRGMTVTKALKTNSDLVSFVTDTAKTSDSYYILVNDLTSFYTNGTTSDNSFQGTFDGLNHTIDGFSSWGYGLFGYLNGGAVVKNITIKNIVNGYMFAAKLKDCTIENVNLSVDYSLTTMGKNNNALLGYQVEGGTTFKNVLFDLGQISSLSNLLTGKSAMGSSDTNTYENLNIRGLTPCLNNIFDTNVRPMASEVYYQNSYIVDFDNGVPFTGYTIKLANKANSEQWDYIHMARRQLIQHLRDGSPNTSITASTISSPVSSTTKAIVVADEASYTNAGLPSEDIQFDSVYDYTIKTKDNAVYIMAGGYVGYQKAINRFLIEVLGFESIGTDTWIYEKDGQTLPKMDIVSTIDGIDSSVSFGTHTTLDSSNCAWAYDIDMSCEYQSFVNGVKNPNIDSDGFYFHNSLSVIDPAIYGTSHPDWYATYTQAFHGYGPTTSAQHSSLGQLCFTAKGNESERNALVQEVADCLIYTAQNTTVREGKELHLTFGTMDNDGYCQCSACQAAKANYGGSNAALVLDFLNDVDDIVEPELASQGLPQIELSFFAYKNYFDAPTEGTITANEHIHCFVAAINMKDTAPITDSSNSSSKASIDGWSKVCDDNYLWLYETNFDNFFYPINTYSSMIENIEYAKKQNISMIWIQNDQTVEPDGRTGFGALKSYLNSLSYQDKRKTYSEKLNTYFENYFGDSDGYMRTMFNTISEHLEDLETSYPSIATGKHSANLATTTCWSESLLNELYDYATSAYSEAETKYASDATLKAKIQKHIKAEMLFPIWALINLYDRTDLRSTFKSYADELNVVRWKESGTDGLLSTVYSNWGI